MVDESNPGLSHRRKVFESHVHLFTLVAKDFGEPKFFIAPLAP